MTNTFKLSFILLCAVVLFSCKNEENDLYGISEKHSYGGFSTEIGNNDGSSVSDYIEGFVKRFEITGTSVNDRNAKAKTRFEEEMSSFSQDTLQAKLEELLGATDAAAVTVKFYLYKSGNSSEDIVDIDSTELYTAQKN